MLGACGDGGGDASVRIAATTGIAADIARQVAGVDAEVVQLIPDGSSPHSYAPSAPERQQLEEADLLVLFHPELEATVPVGSAERSYAIAEHAGGLRAFEEGDHGDGHGSEDPHVWLDPTKVATALGGLAAALGEVDPAHARGYEARAGSYAAELEELDRELEALLAAVPSDRRKLVTSHELMGYFGDRYGFELVAAPLGPAPEAEASAADLAALIEAIEREDVDVVFAQRGEDPSLLRRIAEGAGVEVVDDLLLESLGPDADSYPEMLRLSAARISGALSG